MSEAALGKDRVMIEISRAVESDIPDMLDLLAAVAAEGKWVATELPFDRAARGKHMLENVTRGGGYSVVARSGGAIVGEASLRPQRAGIYELGMCVGAEYRGQGVGTALLTPLVAWAREHGAHKVCLDVFAHNAAAIALYQKLGFVTEGTFRAHLRRKSGELWDVLSMSLFLFASVSETVRLETRLFVSDVLLVIDVQRALVDYLEPERRATFTSTLGALIGRARSRAVPVVYVRHHDEELVAGTQAWEIASEIGPQPGEAIVEKRFRDAFRETNLADVLHSLRANTIVICGMQTEYCIDATVREAERRGFRVTLVADGHATYPVDGMTELAIREHVHRIIRGAVADVVDSADISFTSA